jgi:hypothetical protein
VAHDRRRDHPLSADKVTFVPSPAEDRTVRTDWPVDWVCERTGDAIGQPVAIDKRGALLVADDVGKHHLPDQ